MTDGDAALAAQRNLDGVSLAVALGRLHLEADRITRRGLARDTGGNRAEPRGRPEERTAAHAGQVVEPLGPNPAVLLPVGRQPWRRGVHGRRVDLDRVEGRPGRGDLPAEIAQLALDLRIEDEAVRDVDDRLARVEVAQGLEQRVHRVHRVRVARARVPDQAASLVGHAGLALLDRRHRNAVVELGRSDRAAADAVAVDDRRLRARHAALDADRLADRHRHQRIDLLRFHAANAADRLEHRAMVAGRLDDGTAARQGDQAEPIARREVVDQALEAVERGAAVAEAHVVAIDDEQDHPGRLGDVVAAHVGQRVVGPGLWSTHRDQLEGIDGPRLAVDGDGEVVGREAGDRTPVLVDDDGVDGDEVDARSEDGLLRVSDQGHDDEADGEQPAVKVPRGPEMGEAPAGPGARRKNIGHIRPTSNAERRDASPIEGSGTFTAGCRDGPPHDDQRRHSTTASPFGTGHLARVKRRSIQLHGSWPFGKLDLRGFVTPALR